MSRELDFFKNEIIRLTRQFGMMASFILRDSDRVIVVYVRMMIQHLPDIASEPYEWAINVSHREICHDPEWAVKTVMIRFMEGFVHKNVKSFFRQPDQEKHPLIIMAELVEAAARRRGELL